MSPHLARRSFVKLGIMGSVGGWLGRAGAAWAQEAASGRNVPFVDLAVNATGDGVWTLDQMGRIFSLGAAPPLSRPPNRITELFRALAATPSGEGLVALTARGHLELLGDAALPAGTAMPRRDRPVPFVDLAVTSTREGLGVWVLDQIGRIVALGTAPRLAEPLERVRGPFVALAALPSELGVGAYALTQHGRIRGLGDARAFDGLDISEVIPCVIPMPFVDFALTPNGNGFWALDETGAVIPIGGAPAFDAPPEPAPVPSVALAATAAGTGLFALAQNGRLALFGDARLGELIPCI
jgi:hypothetical protein